MIITLFAAVLAILLSWHPYFLLSSPPAGSLASLFLIVGALYGSIIALAFMVAWLPLEKSARHVSSYLMDLYFKDRYLALYSLYGALFSLLSLALSLVSHFLELHIFAIALWLLLFGVALDILRHLTLRISGYFDPHEAIRRFSREAKHTIQDEKEADLCRWIDALAEVAIKGAEEHSSSLCHQAIDELRQLSCLFLEASTSISHHEQDADTKALGIADKISYMQIYLYQRLDVVMEKSLANRLEMTASHLIAAMGKIAIAAAKCDFTLAGVPLRFMGKFARRAQQEGFEEAAVTATCLFLEIARILLTEIEIGYYEIKEAFLIIVNSLEELAQGAFRRNKQIHIPLLLQPFLDLKALFEKGKAKEHQDAPVIIQAIDRVVGQFEALQAVMVAMPPILKEQEGEAKREQ